MQRCRKAICSNWINRTKWFDDNTNFFYLKVNKTCFSSLIQSCYLFLALSCCVWGLAAFPGGCLGPGWLFLLESEPFSLFFPPGAPESFLPFLKRKRYSAQVQLLKAVMMLNLQKTLTKWTKSQTCAGHWFISGSFTMQRKDMYVSATVAFTLTCTALHSWLKLSAKSEDCNTEQCPVLGRQENRIFSCLPVCFLALYWCFWGHLEEVLLWVCPNGD